MFWVLSFTVVINSIKIFPDRICLNPGSTFNILSYVFDTILFLSGIIYLKSEAKQYLKVGFKKYFSVNNKLDILSFLLLLCTTLFDVLNTSKLVNSVDALKFFHSITLLIILIRALTFLRGFQGTAFMVRMLGQVFIDFRHFFLIMIFLDVTLAFMSFLIQKEYALRRWTVMKGLYLI